SSLGARPLRLRWSPDGSQLAVDTYTHAASSIEIWNINPITATYQWATSIPTQSLSTFGQTVTMTWNPVPSNGAHQLAIANDQTLEIEIWELTAVSSRLIRQWQPSNDPIAALAWSPDGSKIASSHFDK